MEIIKCFSLLKVYFLPFYSCDHMHLVLVVLLFLLLPNKKCPHEKKNHKWINMISNMQIFSVLSFQMTFAENLERKKPVKPDEVDDFEVVVLPACPPCISCTMMWRLQTIQGLNVKIKRSSRLTVVTLDRLPMGHTGGRINLWACPAFSDEHLLKLFLLVLWSSPLLLSSQRF